MAEKLTKQEAGWRKATDSKTCHNCSHRQGDTCDVVDVVTDPEYVSHLWHPRAT